MPVNKHLYNLEYENYVFFLLKLNSKDSIKTNWTYRVANASTTVGFTLQLRVRGCMFFPSHIFHWFQGFFSFFFFLCRFSIGPFYANAYQQKNNNPKTNKKNKSINFRSLLLLQWCPRGLPSPSQQSEGGGGVTPWTSQFTTVRPAITFTPTWTSNVHVFALWEETRVPGQNPHSHRVNMQTPRRPWNQTSSRSVRRPTHLQPVTKDTDALRGKFSHWI